VESGPKCQGDAEEEPTGGRMETDESMNEKRVQRGSGKNYTIREKRD